MKEELSTRCKNKVIAHNLELYLNYEQPPHISKSCMHDFRGHKTRIRYSIIGLGVHLDCITKEIVIYVKPLYYLDKCVTKLGRWLESKLDIEEGWELPYNSFSEYHSEKVAFINPQRKEVTIRSEQYYDVIKKWAVKYNYKEIIKDWC